MAQAASKNEMNHGLLKKWFASEVLGFVNEGREQEFSFLLEGPHGIGKSQFFKDMCVELDGFMIDMRLGQRDLGDIIGMPQVLEDDKGQPRFKHILPEIIRPAFISDLNELGTLGNPTYEDKLSKYRDPKKKDAPFKFVLLFLDEYNRGTKDVMQSVFEIVYDRSMNGRRVHPSVWICAACNDNMDVYTITEGDPAFRSRFRTIKYKPTVDEWLKWGKETGELEEELLELFNMKKDLADPPPSKMSNIEFLNQPHPNRRSWHMFSRWLKHNRDNFSLVEIRDILATYVGGEVAEIFRMTVEQMDSLSKRRKKSSVTEAASVIEAWDGYMRYGKMTEKEFADRISKMNPSELTAFTQLAVEQCNKYTYITAGIRGRIAAMAQNIPGEVFAKIWQGISDGKFRSTMKDWAVKEMKQPGFFDKFDKM